MLISKEYRELNRKLHESNPLYGADSFGWSGWAKELVINNEYKTVLDYGCGKGNLKLALEGVDCEVAEYDPAIEGKDDEPSPAELVTCCDVLEHIEPVHLNAVLRHLKSLTQKRLFATISCRPASKTLEDGRNAHLIVKDSDWWHERLANYFQILLWEQRGTTIACELCPKDYIGRKHVRARRGMTTEMVAFFQKIRDDVNVASDVFSQLKTIRMWEGFEDAPADLCGVYDVLEHMDDVDTALMDIARNTLKVTWILVKLSPAHTMWDWRRVMERRFNIASCETDGTQVLMLGAPGVSVQGIKPVGAVDSDIRWGNVEAALGRTTGRIATAHPHGRVAVLACYGPSLVDTIGQLKELSTQENIDVISVSGAHDFLLENGIVPKYHVECDPRPHKALNLDKSHPDVEYLIASVCHPDYFDRLGEANIKLWHVSTSEHHFRLINERGESPQSLISGGGSVGLRSIPLLYALGYRDMYIFGMDCSFKQEGEMVNQWAGKHAGKKQDMCEVMCDGAIFISSPVLLTYATNFFETIQKVTDLNVRLYGNGLLAAMVEYYAREGSAAVNKIETTAA